MRTIRCRTPSLTLLYGLAGCTADVPSSALDETGIAISTASGDPMCGFSAEPFVQFLPLPALVGPPRTWPLPA